MGDTQRLEASGIYKIIPRKEYRYKGKIASSKCCGKHTYQKNYKEACRNNAEN
jgi:hypothetical protein